MDLVRKFQQIPCPLRELNQCARVCPRTKFNFVMSYSESNKLVISIVNQSIDGLVNIEHLNGTKPGYTVELTQLICDQLHLACEFKVTPRSSYWQFDNGSRLQGMLNDIIQGVHNTSLPVFYGTGENLDKFHFTNVAVRFSLYFVTRHPASEDTLSLIVLLKPFSWQLWLLILFILFLISLFLHLLRQKKILIPGNLRRFLLVFLNISAYLVRKSPRIVDVGRTGNLILACWGLCALLLISSYTGGLLSKMFKVDGRIPFSNLPSLIECITNDLCKIVTVTGKDDWFMQSLANNQSHYFILGNAIKLKGFVQVNSAKESFAFIRDNTELFFVTAPILREVIGVQKCVMALIEDTVEYRYPFKAGNTNVKRFNEQLRKLESTGIMTRIARKYLSLDVCERLKRTTKTSPIPLKVLIGAILALIIGASLGSLSLVFEYAKYHQRKFNRKRMSRKACHF